MAFDIGVTRTGIAVSDASGRVASPVCTLQTKEMLVNCKEFKVLMQDWQPDFFVFGLPLSLQGKQSAQAQFTKNTALKLLKLYPAKHAFFDERYSSKSASKTLNELGISQKEKKGKIDMLAASIVLQAYLDKVKLQREGKNEAG